MNLKALNNDQLVAGTERHLENERMSSHHALLHLQEIECRKLYADRGFPNLYAMLIGHFRQSEPAARQRLKALELLDVPAVDERLQKGELNLSTLAMASRQIHREEKVTGRKVSFEKKIEVVERITNKTVAQAEVELMKLLPESSTHPQTHQRRVSADAVRVSLTLPNDVLEALKRLQEVWAHVDPSMDLVEVIKRSADIALEKVDPTKKKTRRTTESVHQCVKGRRTYLSVAIKKTLWERAKSQCEYIDEQTGRRCECKFGPEKDHIIPLALGGSNEFSNLRLLCKAHNLLMARRHFGSAKIEEEIRRRR
jgi:5-methylcytosine-specific restriction endonuclease McrA